jgi:hypothetical protein
MLAQGFAACAASGKLVELTMMLRLACGAQQKGPELNGLGVDVMSSVKGDAGTGIGLYRTRL